MKFFFYTFVLLFPIMVLSSFFFISPKVVRFSEMNFNFLKPHALVYNSQGPECRLLIAMHVVLKCWLFFSRDLFSNVLS